MKFLGIKIYNKIAWKSHTDMTVPKLCAACFVIRTVKPFMSLGTLKMIEYSYFHCIMNYGVTV
jgi:hypothetical protein